MRAQRPLVAGAVTIVAALVLAAAGCGSGIKVEYTESGRNPVIIYERTAALPPVYDAEGPDIIIYGDGTTFRVTGPTEIKRGSLTEKELKGLLSSIVGQGFFALSAKGEEPPLGGDTDHVTVRLKGNSNSVSAGAATATSPFKDIVEQLTNLKIKNEKEYVPDNIVLYASVLQGAPPAEGKVLTWDLDPELLGNASNSKTRGIGVSGADAQAVWKALKDAPGSLDEIYWAAGDRIYARVVAIPQFPMPGV